MTLRKTVKLMLKSSNHNPYTGRLSRKDNLIAAIELAKLCKDFADKGQTDEAMNLDSNHWQQTIDKLQSVQRCSFNFKLQILFLAPFWLLSTSPTRKTWKEFKSGLIKHECVYDYSKPCYDTGKHYKCEHLGCNIVSVRNEDGSWC